MEHLHKGLAAVRMQAETAELQRALAAAYGARDAAQTAQSACAKAADGAAARAAAADHAIAEERAASEAAAAQVPRPFLHCMLACHWHAVHHRPACSHQATMHRTDQLMSLYMQQAARDSSALAASTAEVESLRKQLADTLAASSNQPPASVQVRDQYSDLPQNDVGMRSTTGVSGTLPSGTDR